MTDYIASLLYRYECVVIPGFGAFLTHRKPAEIDKDNQAFYPPKKSISFNRQLQENDGVLVNYIAQVEGISYEQSLKKVYAFRENLNEALETYDEVYLNKIGTFIKQIDKTLFQPDTAQNYLSEAFGLSAVKAQSIAPLQAEIPAENKGVTLPISAAHTSKPTFWRYAAVGIIAIGIGGFLGAGWYSNQVRTHNALAQQQAEQQIENRIQQATFAIDDPLPEITFKVTAKRGTFHIVAGAFRDKQNAENVLKELKDSGFHPLYIGENKYGLHQVIYDSFEDRQEAVKELRKIRSSVNPNAWLLIKDL